MGDLFLSDDDVSDDRWSRRSRPRWVDGLGLGALVLGIVAIGVLGDRSAPERAAAPTTTTSTTSAFRRGTPYASTTTTEPPSTTTTLFLEVGGRLPFATGAVVLVTAPSSTTLVDVDGGRARRVLSSAYGVLAVEGGFLLPLEGKLRFLPSAGGDVVVHELPPGTGGDQLLPGGPGRVWVLDGQPAPTITEVDLSGVPTGRHVQLPIGTYPAGVVDDGIVVAARGSLVLVDGTGRSRSLGTGELLSARGRTILRTSCHLLVCRTDVVDVPTGRARPVDVPDSYYRQAVLSPDGRSVAISQATPTGVQQLTFTDLRTGRTWTSEGIDAQTNVAFAPDGRTVFATSAGSLCAFPTATGERHCLELGDGFGQVQGIAAVNRP